MHDTEISFSKDEETYLKLGVAGYEFPDAHDEEFDANWLVITGRASIDGNGWSFEDPCLLTFELAELADWLEELAAGKAMRQEVGFIEPNLSFAHLENGRIRIFFELEARPPWNASQGAYQNDLYIDIDMSREELKAAAAQFRAMLAAFPPRQGPLP